MSTELVTQPQNQVTSFGQSKALAPGVNAGAVTIESERAVAEARGQIQLAKMFPRDLNAAYAELMDACKLPALANVAFYSVPRGGSRVTGPSIRLAEEIARVYGNFEYGHRELSRSGDKSEVEVYAWDKEKNNRSPRQLTVMHVLDTKDGPRKLRDQKDIDDKIANVASKQVRGRILALLPKWLVEAAVEECKKTLAGTNDEPLSVRVRKMTQAFARFGVTAEHIERHLGHKLDDILLDELVELTGIFNALKDGAAPSEYFGAQEKVETAASTAAAIAETAKQGAAKAKAAPSKAAAPAAPTEAPVPAPSADSKPVQKESKPVEAPAPETQQDGAASDDGGDVF